MTTSWHDTPYQRGFLLAAVADAEVAVQHTGLMVRDPTNLEAIKMHARHVLHAVDASQIEQGPGTGYGVKRAAQNIAAHIEMAAEVEGASQAVITHSVHVASSARNTVGRSDEIATLAREIQDAGTAAEAMGLAERLQTLTTQLFSGVDADGDGRVGWQEGEGGLDTVQQHVDLMLR